MTKVKPWMLWIAFIVLLAWSILMWMLDTALRKLFFWT